MLYTFCPKCGTKTDWALTCSACGAAIPLYNFDQTIKTGAAATRGCPGNAPAGQDASTEQTGTPLLPIIIFLGAIGVIVLGITLLP